MALPIRNLPLVQHWECHTCSDCCRIEAPLLSAAEKERIEKLDLAGDTEIAPGPWFVRRGRWWARGWALRRRSDGTCVFLTRERRCRLQERFGPDAKPLACRLFPFILVPAGSHWRVGLRFLCPSVAQNRGRPLLGYDASLVELAQLLEKHLGRAPDSAAPPPLQRGQILPWPDVCRIVQALSAIVEDRSTRLERRLRKCLALSRLCRQARLDNLHGGRLHEFFRVAGSGLDADVPADPATLPSPGWVGRVLFRTLLAVYARRDLGLHRGAATRTRLTRLHAGWRFVRGRGPVPPVNAYLGSVSFEDIAARPALPAEIDETLERYYLTKLQSLQFCGAANFGLSLWDGLEALLATYPALVWLAKALAAPAPQRAVELALSLVDDHFGGNPLLGTRPLRRFPRTLAERGELDRLIAWVSQ